MRKKIAFATAVAVVGGIVAQGAVAAAPPSSIVKITAVKMGLAYNTKVLKAKAGRIEIIFANQSMLKHNVRLEIGEKEYGGTKTIGKGTTIAYVTLNAGRYHFYCSVPGHEDAGMSGYLTVS